MFPDKLVKRKWIKNEVFPAADLSKLIITEF